MPDIAHSLQGNDLGFLKIIANSWGLELDAPDAYSALPIIVDSLQNKTLVQEVIEALPEEARYALKVLLDNDGRISWAHFSRRFGELRSMGPAKRDRERPDLDPISITEILWYRALISKAFLNTLPEPQEYAYIPDDLIENLPLLHNETELPLGRPASPGECQHIIPTRDTILDDACTLLAAYRMKMKPEDLKAYHWYVPVRILTELLRCSGLIDTKDFPKPEATRQFLESSRPDALLFLANSWMNNPVFDELRLLPGLILEGEWSNDALQTRNIIIQMLQKIPGDTWWNLSSFINAVREKNPDFQRPAGDYDSWFIRRQEDDQYLRGFDSWNEVDGALISFMITGPLHWLGFFDLAAPSQDGEATAFRFSHWAPALWKREKPSIPAEEDELLHVNSNGVIQAYLLTPRSARYQISRFCEWEGQKSNIYSYRLTPASLKRAQQQKLRIPQLLSLLHRYAKGPLPPNLLNALEQYERLGVQASIQSIMVLQVDSEQAIEALEKTRAAKYILQKLSPTTIQIKSEGIEKIRTALIECGYLAHIEAGE